MKTYSTGEIAALECQAINLKRTLLQMIHQAKSGHPGGSLSAADMITALYFHEMRIDPAHPKWDDRDRFVLSKGHVCPVLYSALMLKGYFSMDEISNLRKKSSILQGHPDMKRTPGVEISTGSLGQGFSAAVGMAIAAKRDRKDSRVFVMVGDGECNEGQIWEAAQTAYKYQLDNLLLLVDNNRLQNDGSCEEIMPTLDLAEKFKAFGFEVLEIDGHCMTEIVEALHQMREVTGRPKAIIAHTTKGKGVSFMENVVMWHGLAPDAEQCKQAINEIEGGRS